ncbi:hypothetical protein GMI70_08675 [Eggerthellaceae bacterium zg-893]|nr:hypothetical protein [Eggerthellaceae bacterium zg-893]
MFERILTMKGTFEGKVVSVLLSIVLVLSMSNVLAFAQVGSALAEDGQGEGVPAVKEEKDTPSEPVNQDVPAGTAVTEKQDTPAVDNGSNSSTVTEEKDTPANQTGVEELDESEDSDEPNAEDDTDESGSGETPDSDNGTETDNENNTSAMSGTITASGVSGSGTQADPYIVVPSGSVALAYSGLDGSAWRIANEWLPPYWVDWDKDAVQGVASFAQSASGTLATVTVDPEALDGAHFAVRYGECVAYFEVNKEEPETAPGFRISAEDPSLIKDGKITLPVGGEVRLIATPQSADASEVEWLSGSEYVATVDKNGIVTGAAEGTTTIKATRGDESATITVDVEKYYTIEFKTTGGDKKAPEPKKAVCNDTIEFPGYSGTKKTQDGKELSFVGWSTDSEANDTSHYTSQVYYPGSRYTVKGNEIFHAIWAEQGIGAIFYLRTDGKIPEEPSSQPTSEYTPGIGMLDKDVIGRATFYSNQNGIEGYLKAAPTLDVIQRKFQDWGRDYNPNYYVVWYVMKKEPEGWHVDGALLDSTKATLTYNSNVTDNTVRNMPAGCQYKANSQVTVDPKRPTRSGGYEFVKWTTEPDGNGESFDPSAPISLDGTETKTLYAQWKSTNCYTVKFHPNGGNGDESSQEAAFKGAVEFPESPGTKSGMLFVGWSTNPSANSLGSTSRIYAPRSQYIVKGNKDFYAIWAEQGVQAKFYIRTDGQIPQEPAPQPTSKYVQVTNEDGSEIQNHAIQRAAFTYDQDGIDAYLNKDGVPDNDKIKNTLKTHGIEYDPKTQYVTWYVIKQEEDGWHVDGVLLNKKLVNLTYNRNVPDGNTVENMPDGGQCERGKDAQVAPERPTRSGGYEFVEWNTQQDGKGQGYQPGGTIRMDKGKTLYAQWRNKNICTIEYVVAEGHHGTVTNDEATSPVTNAEVNEGSTAEPDAGYKFDGWYKGGVKIPEAGENLTPEIAGQNLCTATDPETHKPVFTETVFEARFVPDQTQTHTVSYKVNYYKDDKFVESDELVKSKPVWVGETATVEINKQALNTPDKYEGFKLDHVELDHVGIDHVILDHVEYDGINSLPNQLQTTDTGDGEYVINVYYESLPLIQEPVTTVKPVTPDLGPEQNPTTNPTDTNTKPGPDTPPVVTTPTDTETESPTTPQDPTEDPESTPTTTPQGTAQKPELTPTPEAPDSASNSESTPMSGPTLEIAPHSPTGPASAPVPFSAFATPAVPGATTPIAVPTPLMATAAPNPLTTVDVPVNSFGDTTAPSDAAPQSTQESPMGDEGAPLASAPTTIEDGATPLAALMMQETEDGHVGCVVHFYIILGIVLSVVYAAAVALRRAWFSRLLKGYEDDLTGDGGSSDSPAREKASYRPEAAALNGIPAMAAVPVNR